MLKRRLKEAPIHERPELQNILNDIKKKDFGDLQSWKSEKTSKEKSSGSESILLKSLRFRKKAFRGIKEWQAWCTEGGTRESFEDDILRWFKRYPNTSS